MATPPRRKLGCDAGRLDRLRGWALPVLLGAAGDDSRLRRLGSPTLPSIAEPSDLVDDALTDAAVCLAVAAFALDSDPRGARTERDDALAAAAGVPLLPRAEDVLTDAAPLGDFPRVPRPAEEGAAFAVGKNCAVEARAGVDVVAAPEDCPREPCLDEDAPAGDFPPDPRAVADAALADAALADAALADAALAAPGDCPRVPRLDEDVPFAAAGDFPLGSRTVDDAALADAALADAALAAPGDFPLGSRAVVDAALADAALAAAGDFPLTSRAVDDEPGDCPRVPRLDEDVPFAAAGDFPLGSRTVDDAALADAALADAALAAPGDFPLGSRAVVDAALADAALAAAGDFPLTSRAVDDEPVDCPRVPRLDEDAPFAAAGDFPLGSRTVADAALGDAALGDAAWTAPGDRPHVPCVVVAAAGACTPLRPAATGLASTNCVRTARARGGDSNLDDGAISEPGAAGLAAAPGPSDDSVAASFVIAVLAAMAARLGVRGDVGVATAVRAAVRDRALRCSDTGDCSTGVAFVAGFATGAQPAPGAGAGFAATAAPALSTALLGARGIP